MLLNRQRSTTILITTLNLALAVPLLIYASAAIYVRFIADDMCAIAAGREFGILGAVAYWYNAWYGRFLYAFTLHAAGLAGLSVTFIPTIVLLAVWWAALFGIFQIVLGKRPYARSQAAAFTSLVVITLLDGVPRVAKAIYYYSGLLEYFMAVVVFTLYLWVTLQQRIKNRSLVLILCFVLAFAGAAYSDIQGLVQVIVLGTAFLVCRKRTFDSLPSNLKSRLLIGLIGTCIALSIVIAAPGNRIRQSVAPRSNLFYAIYGAVSGAGLAGIVATFQAPLAVIALVALPAWAAYYSKPGIHTLRPRQARVGVLLTVSVAFTLQAACFGPTFYFISYGLAEYQYPILLSITICGFIIVGYLIGLSLRRKPDGRQLSSKLLYLGTLLLIAVAVTSSWQAFKTLMSLKNYAEAWDQRDDQIRADVSSGKAPPAVGDFVNPYGTSYPIDTSRGILIIHSLAEISPYRGEEPSADPGDWVNRCMAAYYHVAAISATSDK